MLRDNTESFASEFTNILTELGIKDQGMGKGAFQLLKFERVEPDVFVWLLRGKGNYVVTLNDGGSSTPTLDWLAAWSSGLTADDLELLLPKSGGLASEASLEDNYDYVHVYRLPEEYDHCDHIDLHV